MRRLHYTYWVVITILYCPNTIIGISWLTCGLVFRAGLLSGNPPGSCMTSDAWLTGRVARILLLCTLGHHRLLFCCTTSWLRTLAENVCVWAWSGYTANGFTDNTGTHPPPQRSLLCKTLLVRKKEHAEKLLELFAACNGVVGRSTKRFSNSPPLLPHPSEAPTLSHLRPHSNQCFFFSRNTA